MFLDEDIEPVTETGPEYSVGCVSADSSIDSLLSRNTRIAIFRARGLFFLRARPSTPAVSTWLGLCIYAKRAVITFVLITPARTFDPPCPFQLARTPPEEKPYPGLHDISQSPSRPCPTVFLNPRSSLAFSPHSSFSPLPPSLTLSHPLSSFSLVCEPRRSCLSSLAVSRVPRITVTIAYLVAFHDSHEIAEASTAHALEY